MRKPKDIPASVNRLRFFASLHTLIALLCLGKGGMKRVSFNIHNPSSYNFSVPASVTLRWSESSLAASCLPVVNEILPTDWHKPALRCKLCFVTQWA